jgi:hypothetical protein
MYINCVFVISLFQPGMILARNYSIRSTMAIISIKELVLH